MKKLISKSLLPIFLISCVSVIIAYLIGMLIVNSENPGMTFSLLSIVFIVFIPICKILFKRLIENELEDIKSFNFIPFFVSTLVIAIASTFAFDFLLGMTILEEFSSNYGQLLISEIETYEVLLPEDRAEILSLPFLLQTYIVQVFFILIGVLWSALSIKKYWNNNFSNNLELQYAK